MAHARTQNGSRSRPDRSAEADPGRVVPVSPEDDPDAPDRLDRMLDVWAREIPALDSLTEGVVERIETLAHDFEASLDETLGAFELDRRSYHLLGRLRAAGEPYQLAAGQLARELRLSSGAMTNRLDRMEAAGLIRRLPDPNDRRGVLVEPTAEGHAIWDRTVDVQAQREALLASVLDASERAELHRLLRRLMRAFPKGAKHAAKFDPGRDSGNNGTT